MESFSFRMKEMTFKDDFILDVHYRPPKQVEQVDNNNKRSLKF